MEKNEILAAICEVLQEFNRFNVPISPQTRLEEDLSIDSLGIMVLISELEKRFRIRIDHQTELRRQNFRTVGTVCEFLKRKSE